MLKKTNTFKSTNIKSRKYILNGDKNQIATITKHKNGNTTINYSHSGNSNGSLILNKKEGTFKNAETILKRTRSKVSRVK